MNLELMTQPSQSLKTLKAAVLKNLESFYKESFFQYEQSYFRFSAKDIEITNEDEELSLNLLISKVKILNLLVLLEKNHIE